MSKNYIQLQTYVLDIGCSKGTLIQKIHDNCSLNRTTNPEEKDLTFFERFKKKKLG